MGLTDFFIDYIPMYNKFRAVSSILVIAEFTIPLLAIFALKEILSKPDILKLKENRTGVIVTLVLTAGVALILAVAPGVFFSNFSSGQEMAALKQGLPAEHLVPVMTSLKDMREAILTSDAWRSFFYHRYRLPAFILISTEEVESLIHLRRYCTSVSDRYVECQQTLFV